jgi:hypothetical protein
MRLPAAARVAVIGAGPGGLVAAKHALEVGFDVSVFEASDDLGGQWHTTAPHSGVWPGMRTNTSRTMTAFSDFPPPKEHDLFPLAEQVHAYLRRYAAAFGVADRIRLNSPVTSLRPGWSVNGEPYDAVIVASGRFRRPMIPDQLRGFGGEIVHAYGYAGHELFRGRRVLVYGNGVSGHEIASDLAEVTAVVSAYRKPRYVLQKVVDGVPADWRWYTHLGALQRAQMTRAEWARLLLDRVVRISGNPADFGAPRPDHDILIAGHSLCQNYLNQVREGQIVCRPEITGVDTSTVTFADGSREHVDAIVCATGYALDIPYLPAEVWSTVGAQLCLHHRTVHPDLRGLAFIGQFALQGPYFPLLELQARWIANMWSGLVRPPDVATMRASIAEPPPAVDSHNLFAVSLASLSGVAPDVEAHPMLAEPLLCGPMLPPRYRLDGPGALPGAAALFAEQLGTSRRAAVDPQDLDMLPQLGLQQVASMLGSRVGGTP